ncbi:small multi-drug export protein [bacterium]|nr:small multi-drug export protein [bacterium]
MHDIIISWFQNFPGELATFLIAIIPVTELRASIPLAYNVYGLSVFSAWFWSVAGTFFTMLMIVLILDPIAKFLSKYSEIFRKFFKWIFEHTRKRNSEKIEKYEEWAIFILAATPIPFLGGMTGALVAFVFGIALKKSIPLLLLGTMLAGGIVLFLTMGYGKVNG